MSNRHLAARHLFLVRCNELETGRHRAAYPACVDIATFAPLGFRVPGEAVDVVRRLQFMSFDFTVDANIGESDFFQHLATAASHTRLQG